MANILVLPTCAHVDAAAAAQSIAAALPDAVVFNPLADAKRAADLKPTIGLMLWWAKLPRWAKKMW